MSTYLLAFIVGEFDFVEGQSKDGVLVRVYTPLGKKEQVCHGTRTMLARLVSCSIRSEIVYIKTQHNSARPITIDRLTLRSTIRQGEFALDVAVKTLPFYKDYFNIAYPLPKIDLIAIPDFAAGAMENWGLVTYR